MLSPTSTYTKITDTATNIKSDGSGALTGDAATYVNAGIAVKVTGEASLDQLKAIDAVTDKPTPRSPTLQPTSNPMAAVH